MVTHDRGDDPGGVPEDAAASPRHDLSFPEGAGVETFCGLLDGSALPSRFEFQPITLLESMVHGLPVETTRVGGNPGRVVDGENGFPVPPDRSGSFVGRVVASIREPGKGAGMGRAGRARACGELTLQAAVQSCLVIYREQVSLVEDEREEVCGG